VVTPGVVRENVLPTIVRRDEEPKRTRKRSA
jgi:ATP-dependent Clp protease ATP-binding subunit ClpX